MFPKLCSQSQTKCIQFLTARRFPPLCRVATNHVQEIVIKVTSGRITSRTTMKTAKVIRAVDESAAVTADQVVEIRA